MPPTAKPIAERFWPKVDRSLGDDACWPWMAHVAWNGYGEFRLPTRKGRLVKAHRVAYELSVGPIDDRLDLDHKCRNRRCCNPRHLEPVTRAENAKRGLSGMHRSKLSEQECREIIALRGVVSCAELAARYSVSKASISRVQLHYNDAHISRLDRFQKLERHQGSS